MGDQPEEMEPATTTSRSDRRYVSTVRFITEAKFLITASSKKEAKRIAIAHAERLKARHVNLEKEQHD